MILSPVWVGEYESVNNKKSRFHWPVTVENRLFGKMLRPDYSVTSYSVTFNVSRRLSFPFIHLLFQDID